MMLPTGQVHGAAHDGAATPSSFEGATPTPWRGTVTDGMDIGSHLNGLTARLLPAPAVPAGVKESLDPRAQPSAGQIGGLAGLHLLGTAVALLLPGTAAASCLLLRRTCLARLGTEGALTLVTHHYAAAASPRAAWVRPVGSAVAELCMGAAAVNATHGSAAMLGGCWLMFGPKIGLLLVGCGRDDDAALRLLRLPDPILRDGLLGLPEALLWRCAAAAAARGNGRARAIAANLAMALHALICPPRLAVALCIGAEVALGAAIGTGIAAGAAIGSRVRAT